MLRVHSIETFGTHEGPGIRLVVFLQGCNFRCLYCHNPDTQNMTGGTLIQSEEIIDLLEKQKTYFKNNGGLTVSGGEPLLQRQGLIDLFTKVKKAGFNIALDTNGSIFDEHTRQLLKFVDLVLLDVKHIDLAWHQKVTGAANIGTLKLAKYLNDEKIPMWFSANVHYSSNYYNPNVHVLGQKKFFKPEFFNRQNQIVNVLVLE